MHFELKNNCLSPYMKFIQFMIILICIKILIFNSEEQQIFHIKDYPS